MNGPLKPQDVAALVAAQIRASHGWSYQSLATEMSVSSSYLHAALTRAEAAGLFYRDAKRVNVPALLQLVRHGLRWVYFPELGAMARGVPTAHSAPPLSHVLQGSAGEPLVWPDAGGRVRGQSLVPLYPHAAAVADRAPDLYEAITLLDAVRLGRRRDSTIAVDMLTQRLGGTGETRSRATR